MTDRLRPNWSNGSNNNHIVVLHEVTLDAILETRQEMADNLNNDSEPHLRKIFDEACKLFKEIENSDIPSTSKPLQDKIQNCTKLFSDATSMVNIIQLFSRNEELTEISSSNLRYLLLPAFLGELTLLQISDDRYSNVDRAKVYFEDFFVRCKDYGITDQDMPRFENESTTSGIGSYQKSMADRQAKIERYKKSKELKCVLEALEKRLEVSPNAVDDEIEREYYLSWIKLWLNEAIEKLSLIKSEQEILKHMNNVKSGRFRPPEEKQETREPIKPILITKNSLKSKVFGAGYPSLPAMTPEEWMDKQIAEGKVVLDYNPNVNSAPADKDSSDEEDDSEEKLKKQRNWDDWKDEHRRGEGNRINRG